MVHKSQQLKYYSQQSRFTNPGEFSYLFKDLPKSLPEIVKILQGIEIDRDLFQLYSTGSLNNEQKQDAESRYVSKILSVILERDQRPLIVERGPEKRFVGSCRDFAVLLCSVLRYQGVSARVRCGFDNYFHIKPGFYDDHWLCEYWNDEKNKWVLVDAEIDETIKGKYKIKINSLDIPHGEFLLAGTAWQMCRQGLATPDQFGVSAIDIGGLWFVRGSVLRDLMALNKIELLPWDYTEFSDRQFKGFSEMSDEDIKLIDKIVDITTRADDEAFLEMRALYDNDIRLQTTKGIKSYTTFDGLKIINLGN